MIKVRPEGRFPCQQWQFLSGVEAQKALECPNLDLPPSPLSFPRRLDLLLQIPYQQQHRPAPGPSPHPIRLSRHSTRFHCLLACSVYARSTFASFASICQQRASNCKETLGSVRHASLCCCNTRPAARLHATLATAPRTLRTTRIHSRRNHEAFSRPLLRPAPGSNYIRMAFHAEQPRRRPQEGDRTSTHSAPRRFLEQRLIGTLV